MWHFSNLRSTRKSKHKHRADRPSGRGGPLGRPSADLDEAPPSYDQEANRATSGGGMVSRAGGEPAHKARRSQ
jgi:hypothetical protein